MENQFTIPSHASTFEAVIKYTLAKQFIAPHPPIIFISPGETWDVVRKLPNRRVPGSDGISNCALKHCGSKTIIRLCNIYNCCLRSEYFPTNWKFATMIMIPERSKDVLIPTNHHPISLLNSLSKVFEHLLLKRLKTYTIAHSRPEQFDFCQNHSTTTQLLRVTDHIANNLNLRLKTTAVLLDVEKAFDNVWNDVLIFKLINSGVPNQLINLLKSFPSHRTFRVNVDGTLSSPNMITAGVPQGFCLSPELFSVFINDMPQHKSSNTALFADDTIFYATSTSNNNAAHKLQAQIDLVQPWLHNWKISINHAILFSNKSTFYTKRIVIKNRQLEWISSIKYLGVTIDNKLTFNKHIQSTLSKANIVKFTLFPIINPSNSLAINTKIFIYKTYIRPIITYAGPI